jgi:capsular polysaccharide biosynthesis protein
MTLKLYLWVTALLITTLTQPNWWFNIVPVKELIKQNPNIEYHKCYDEISFTYKPFPLSINPASHPHTGFFKENFILTIPQATVQAYGLVLANNQFIQELIWKGWYHNLVHVQKFNDHQIIQVPGRLAVFTHEAAHNYFHWISEMLSRLAMLEMQGMEYDYLYVPQTTAHFIPETLKLWGIDPKKIVTTPQNTCLQADQLIVPSMVSNVSFGGVVGSCYTQPHLIDYVKTKLLKAALQHQPSIILNPRVFISRKDAPQRLIINEDAVFELFQAQGFERYELDKLCVTDQILLFHNAEVIVSPQGTGLANSIFCKPETKIIELFQCLNDATFWYLSQDLNLNYRPIQTAVFLKDYIPAWSTNTYMPLMIIKKLIDDLNLSTQ